jgi:hypothetical protein
VLDTATAYVPSLPRDTRDAEDGFVGELVLGASRKIRYRRAMDELHRLGDRDLGDLGIAPVRFPSWPGATPSARRRSPGRTAKRRLGAGPTRPMTNAQTTHAALQHGWCFVNLSCLATHCAVQQ